MKLHRDTIWTSVLDATDQELEDLQGVLTFESEDEEKPRTLYDDIERQFYSGLIPFLEGHGFSFEVEDVTPTPTISLKDITIDTDALIGISLRDYQAVATRKALYYGRGITEAATGAGKTSLMAAAIAHFRYYGLANTVVALVPTVYLMQQLAREFEAFGLGKVIRVGGDYRFPAKLGDQDIAVFVVDSAILALKSDGDAAEFIREADMLLLDEVHHGKSYSWKHIAEECEASIRLGYTATVREDPEKWSYEDLILIGLTGKIIFEIRSKELRSRGFLADPLVTMLTVKTGRIPVWVYHKVYNNGIVANKVRNSMILSIANSVYEGENKVMIFVGNKKHGHNLAQKLGFVGCDCVFVHGGSAAHTYNARGDHKVVHWSIDDMHNFVANSKQCILIVTQVGDEGVDLPAVNVLIFAGGGKKYRRSVQRCGRGMRPKPGQNKVFMFDFMDLNHPFLTKHSNYRMWTYREEEFDISESLEHTMQELGCPIVVLRDYLR